MVARDLLFYCPVPKLESIYEESGSLGMNLRTSHICELEHLRSYPSS